MSYKVIYRFMDLQDFNHIYEVGDEYPRSGSETTPSRIRELASTENKIGKPLIRGMQNNNSVKPVDLPNEHSKDLNKTAINRMSTADLQALATEQGIENADEISGAELKKMLIEKFGL